MPKREDGYLKGVGPYSGNDVKLNRKPSDDADKGKSLFNRVNSADDNDGFSGKLPKGE